MKIVLGLLGVLGLTGLIALGVCGAQKASSGRLTSGELPLEREHPTRVGDQEIRRVNESLRRARENGALFVSEDLPPLQAMIDRLDQVQIHTARHFEGWNRGWTQVGASMLAGSLSYYAFTSWATPVGRVVGSGSALLGTGFLVSGVMTVHRSVPDAFFGYMERNLQEWGFRQKLTERLETVVERGYERAGSAAIPETAPHPGVIDAVSEVEAP